MRQEQPVKIIYDGECPFCRSYVAFAWLKDAVGPVELIDGRKAPELVEAYAERGYPIDEGMIVDTGDTVYWGGDAVWAINALTSPNPVLKMLGGRRFLKRIYPALRFGRNSALRVLGKTPIRPSSAD